MDWIEGFRNWLSNVDWTAVWAAIISFSSLINIPAIASLVRSNISTARLTAMSKTNGEFRFESLSRILKTASLVLLVLSLMADMAESERQFDEDLSKCKRISDVQALSFKRASDVSGNSDRINSLKSEAKKLEDEFGRAEVTKK